jgi:outer membrane protein assembly factor BamB
MKTFLTLAVSAAVLSVALAVQAADWPQFRGPDRTGLSKDTGLLKTWPEGGPPLKWTYRDAGVGYSSPAIVGERLYLLGGRGDTEYLIALDVGQGKEVWSAKIGPLFTFKGNQWGDGPRTTPTVDGELIYALGGQGILVCVGAADGKERWRLDLYTGLHGAISPKAQDWGLGWGYTCSPLVDGDQVVCVPGGEEGMLAALDKKTGKPIWRSKELPEPATYASLIVAELGGVRQFIQLTDKGVAGIAAKDGRLLWNYNRRGGFPDVVIPTPICHGDEIYITAGWSAGCDLVKVTAADGKFKAQKGYSNKVMSNREGQLVLVDKYLYGHSEGKGWMCIEWATGKAVWTERNKLGAGSVIYAEGCLYCYGREDGDVVLVDATSEGWKEKGRFRIPQKSTLLKPDGKIWTLPAIANGRLYLRDQELLFCYAITSP